MKQFVTLPKLKRGDQVAIISPSAGLPGLFPWVQDLGIRRLQTVYGLNPQEYPTTRQMGSSLEDRARDIMAAFSDPDIKAVFASIGGDDQIKLIKYLDPIIMSANPKPFFGFSDNTHLHLFLWNLGIPSYYGGGVMNQLAMQVEMDEITRTFIHHALFDTGNYELPASKTYNDEGLSWSDKDNLTKSRKTEPNDGFFWDGTNDASGILWGGCVESLIVQMSANKYLPNDTDLTGTVLFLETAEDIPEHWIIEYLLTGFGERGWLNLFQAILIGRPKAWEFNKPNKPDAKAKYRQEQRDTVIRVVRQYNQTIPIVQNIDFGHTDPQIVMPMGRLVTINTTDKTITAEY